MADTLNGLIAGLQNYVVAPLNAFGLGGYVFDVQGEAQAVLSNEITDHYTEDNKAIQDHIAVKPKRITLRGYVGEVVYAGSRVSGAAQAVQQVTQKLTVVSAYLPLLTASAIQAQEILQSPLNSTVTLNAVESAIPSAANVYGLVKNMLGAFGPEAKQQNAYQYFDACRQQAVLMGIQTPWEFLTNMVIETIEAVQSEDSIFISDFSITFKQIRIAATQTAATPLSGTGGVVSPGGATGQGANAVQSASSTNDGIVPGATLPSPLLQGAQGNITGPSVLAIGSGLSNLFRYQP